MILAQGREHLCRKRPFVALSVALSVAPPDFSPPLELGDKLSD